MKLLLLLSLLCMHNAPLQPQQEKKKTDSVKKVTKPVKVHKASAPLYPSFLIVDIY
ncbi:hypothetical protein [Flavisolibacter ginsenosidimutans]|uniref:hypothetical protein n=1 Tax=Flavisolibacter ginsenosidimutans TaxID=661481 RepID=UPI00155B1F85|nr:hypothetical protein [Flavisolibacter ginsenosidimutans]